MCVCVYIYIQILLLGLLFYIFLRHEWSMSPSFVLITAAATIMQVSGQELLSFTIAAAAIAVKSLQSTWYD